MYRTINYRRSWYCCACCSGESLCFFSFSSSVNITLPNHPDFVFKCLLIFCFGFFFGKRYYLIVIEWGFILAYLPKSTRQYVWYNRLLPSYYKNRASYQSEVPVAQRLLCIASRQALYSSTCINNWKLLSSRSPISRWLYANLLF